MIERASSYARLALWCSLVYAALALGNLLVDLRVTSHEVALTAEETRALVYETRLRVTYTSSNVNAILVQLGLASDEARRAAVSQRRYWDENSQQFHATLVQAEATLKQMADSTRHMDEETTVALRELQSSLKRTTETLDHMDALVSDPNNRATIANLEKATREVASATDNLRETTEHVERVTSYYEKKLTKPVGFVRTLIEVLLGPAWKVVVAARTGK